MEEVKYLWREDLSTQGQPNHESIHRHWNFLFGGSFENEFKFCEHTIVRTGDTSVYTMFNGYKVELSPRGWAIIETVKGNRFKELKELGYHIQNQSFTNEGHDFACKEFRDYRFQHHTYELMNQTWTSFDVFSPRGILEKMSDEDFYKWVSTIPELERKKKIALAQFVKDAEYHESIKAGLNEIENINMVEDKEKLLQITKKIREVVNSEIVFKSVKYTKKPLFSEIINSLNKLEAL